MLPLIKEAIRVNAAFKYREHLKPSIRRASEQDKFEIIATEEQRD
jgi:hypothetical protein